MMIRRRFIKSAAALVLPYLFPRAALALNLEVGNNASLINAIDDVIAGRVDEVSGYYEISNPLKLTGRRGTVKFAPGCEVKFLNNEKSGLVFSQCNDLKIIGGVFSYKIEPTKRIRHGGVLEFSGCSTIMVRDGVFFQSPATGLIFTDCNDASVFNVAIWDTWADGLHFANCNNSIVMDYQSTNTGDDGLAFINYSTHPDAKGGYAKGVTVNGSLARGIAIIGQSNVTIDDFKISNTSGPGLKIGAESFYKTRTPSNITIKNGVIVNAGNWCEAKPNGHGFYVENAEGEIVVDNLEIKTTRIHGVGIAKFSGNLRLKAITIEDVPSSGMTLEANNADLEKIEFKEIGKTPIHFSKIGRATVSGVKVWTYGKVVAASPLIWAVKADSLIVSSVEVLAARRLINRIGGNSVGYHSVTSVSVSQSLMKLLEQW